MIDFCEVYDRFEAIKRALIGLEEKMLNNGATLSATDHSLNLKFLRMAESEAQGLLVLILRIRGSNNTIRRHGQDAAVSWSAGVDHATGQVAMTTTDVFSNSTETYMMEQDQFERLIDYFVTIRQQLRANENVSKDSFNPH